MRTATSTTDHRQPSFLIGAASTAEPAMPGEPLVAPSQKWRSVEEAWSKATSGSAPDDVARLDKRDGGEVTSIAFRARRDGSAIIRRACPRTDDGRAALAAGN